MLIQMMRGQFPSSLPCGLFFDQPSIEGDNAWKIYKQYTVRY